MLVSNAKELIKSGDYAVVVFTRDMFFSFDPSTGQGETGKWKIDPFRLENVNKVIIYCRKFGAGINQVFMGRYTGYHSADLADRYVLQFIEMREIGTTESNWLVFGNGGQNPICVIRN